MFDRVGARNQQFVDRIHLNPNCDSLDSGRSKRINFAVSILLSLLTSGCLQSVSTESVSTESVTLSREDKTSLDGHEQMLEELQKIAARTPNENPYLGRAQIDQLQRELESKSAAELLPITSRVSLMATLGFHKLRIGENEDAISDLHSAYRLWKDRSAEIPGELGNTVLMMLGVAHLRVAETENCINCETGQSCIFPFRIEAIHDHPSGTRDALIYLHELLERRQGDLAARWLMNLAAMSLGKHPEGLSKENVISLDRFLSEEDFPRFINRAPDLGLDTMSLSGGIIIDDFDGDDLLDLVCSDCHPEGQLRLFCNNGDGTFTETTSAAGLTGITGGLNILQADFDNNGSLDILVLRGAWLGEFGRQPNSLLKNDGRGNFRDVTFEAGLGDVHYPTQTAGWADSDLDGDLDLYIGNENYPCQLFVNDGHGVFRDVAQSSGVENGQFTKGVVWGDYDSDGDPDLYVSNLGAPNRLYQNQGSNRFRDVATDLGVREPIAGFPVFFWDFNNDGHLDLSVFSYSADISDIAAHYLGLPVKAELDAHYQNDGASGFVNSTSRLKLDRVTHPMGANFGDLDHDGYLDFYLGTGDIPFQMLMPNLAFRNHHGELFADITQASGLGHLQKGHGIAFADLDRDGDQDIVIEIGGAFAADSFKNAVFENTAPKELRNHWIALRLIGVTSNRSAIGTRIRAVIEENGRERSVYRWVNSGGSFGANPLRQQIGLGQASEIKLLEIDWPTSGIQQRFSNVKAGQLLEIRENANKFKVLPWKGAPFSGRGVGE